MLGKAKVQLGYARYMHLIIPNCDKNQFNYEN